MYNLKPYSDVSVGCIDDDQCPFGFCSSGLCKPSMKECPSSIKNEICSGKGSCVFVDATGNTLPDCQLMDSGCSAMCVCDAEYGGVDCSSTLSAIKGMESSRSKMCAALGYVAELSDPSSDTLSSLTTSLSSTFNPYQFQSDGAISNCLGAYESIFSLSGQGYLSSTSETTAVVKILSSFLQNKKVLKSQLIEGVGQQKVVNSSARYLASNDQFETSFKPYPSKKKWRQWFPPFKSIDVDKHISAGLELIIQGIMDGMVQGESPKYIITDNLRVGVYYDSLDSFHGKVFELPKTLYETLFNVDVPNIYMPMSGLSSCSLIDGLTYVQASFSSWGYNYYPQSGNMITPLVRFSTKLPPSSYSATSIILPPTTTDETFQLSLPFLRNYEFNSGFNSTFPSCAQRGDDTYSHCPTSNVSYSSNNVIFTLSDVSTICPVLGGYNRRRLYSTSSIGASLLASADPTTGILEIGSIIQKTKDDIIYMIEYYPIESIISCVVVFFISCFFGIAIFRRWDIYDQKLISYYLDSVTSYVGTKMKNIQKKMDTNIALGPLRSLNQSSLIKNSLIERQQHGDIRDDSILSPSQRLKLSITKNDNQHLSQLSHMVSQKRKHLNQILPDTLNDNTNGEDISFDEIYTSKEGADTNNKIDNIIKTEIIENYSKNDYIHSILPYNAMTKSESIWSRTIRGLIENHDYFKMFSPHKLFTESRTVDFISLCSRLLMALLLTTIFFQIMYPANYSCENRIFDIQVNVTQKEVCLADTTFIQPTVSECLWHSDNRTCTRRPPPDTIIFYLLVALFIEIVNIFPMILMRRLANICSRKPYFLQPLKERNLTEMDLARALPLRKQKISPLGQLLIDKKLVNEEYGIQFASEKIKNLSLHSDPILISEIKNDSFATLLAKYTYYDLASSEEELSMLFKNIKSYLSVEAVSPSLSEIGIEIDGSPKPLTWYQMLRFGNHKKRLRAKILYARQLSSHIIQDVLNLTENNDEKKNYLDDIGADTRLLHNFILEQISPLKRFALRRVFRWSTRAETTRRPTVNSFLWLFSWIFIFACWLYMVAWILQWASVNNGIAVKAWYLSYITFMIQDVFVYISFEVYIVYVLAVEAVRSQLQRIDQVLNSVVINKLDNNWLYNDKDVTIVQHFSASCRAARSKHLCRLPAAQILMRIDDNDARKCKENETDNKHVNILDRILFFIPAMFARFDDWLQELYINLMIPIIWTAFIVSNCYLFFYVSYIANIFINIILIVIPLINPMIIQPAKNRQILRKKTQQFSLIDMFDYIILRLSSDPCIKPSKSSKWASMNKVINNDTSKFKYDNNYGLILLEEITTKPLLIPRELLALRMSKWSEYWEINIKLDKHYNSTGFLNKILWNTESIHEQYLGDDLQGLLYHYLRFKAKNVIANINDFYEALRITEQRFYLLDKSAIGSLSIAEATKLANYLWTIYDINGTSLNKDEWIDMAEYLAINILSFKNERITFSDFKIWALKTYEDIIKKRQSLVRDKVISRLPPPKQGPTYLFDIDNKDVHDDHPNITADKNIAIKYISKKFYELDNENDGRLDSKKLLYLSDWTWSFYYPDGHCILDDDKIKFREKLSSAIFKHSTYKLSLKSFLAWLQVSELSLLEKRNNIRKKKLSLIDNIVENVTKILKTSKPVENKFNINLFPVSEPHDVGHIDAEKINSLFPSLHESGAIPKTDFVVDEEIENALRKRDEGLRRKEEILKNISKFSTSSSESSDESVISMGKNPLYKESALSSQLDDKYNTDHSYYSSNFSTVSGLSHIPGRPHLPHHHIHNPLSLLSHPHPEESDDDSDKVSEDN